MSKKYDGGICFVAGFLGFLICFVFIIGYFQINELPTINKETLDEVCTQLSGQPSVLNYQASTSEQIVCNPMEKEDEKVLDDGKIILKGYKEEVKEGVDYGECNGGLVMDRGDGYCKYGGVT